MTSDGAAALAQAPLRRAAIRPAVLSAVVGLLGLALPFVQFRANRIVAGEGLRLHDVFGPVGWGIAAAFAAALIFMAAPAVQPRMRLLGGLVAVLMVVLALGSSVAPLTPEGDRLARVSPASGFWLLVLGFSLIAADAQARMGLRLSVRCGLLVGLCLAVLGVLASGWLDGLSVMREYAGRSDLFAREAGRHLLLAFGSLGLALVVGLPVGVLLYRRVALQGPVLGTLNLLQTVPSLALFGLMIPLFGWVAVHVPGAAAAGVAGIGAFPALVALFLYSLLPVVSNTVAGLGGVSAEARDAAVGMGMTDRQVLVQVLLPLALPAILAAVRIVLVQNIGLAVIAGLIGGGGFGTFVFQGLTQTAMDLVMLGALPTIALALVSGTALDLLVQAVSREGRR